MARGVCATDLACHRTKADVRAQRQKERRIVEVHALDHHHSRQNGRSNETDQNAFLAICHFVVLLENRTAQAAFRSQGHKKMPVH